MKIGHIVNKIPLVKQNRETTQLIDSTTLLGVEVEVENYSSYDVYDTAAGYWTAKEDNSLRNHGMELVFAEPLSGADAVAAVTWLFNQASLRKWKVSRLCGAHVHVDARDLELVHFKNFCAAYALAEPLIYNWVGRSRFENMFCLPWYMAEGDLSSIARVAKEGDVDPMRARRFLTDLSKYSGLNINAVVKFGTVEFRMLETTFDIVRFIDWINILLSLKKYALLPDITPDSMCQKIKDHGAWVFAQQVFGLNLVSKMWYPDYDKDIISQGMLTCNFFLDNTKDLMLKGKSPAEQLNWARIANLTKKTSTETHLGEHAGLEKWKARFPRKSVGLDPVKTKKKTVLMEGGSSYTAWASLYALGSDSIVMPTVPTVPQPVEEWIEPPDDYDDFDAPSLLTNEQP